MFNPCQSEDVADCAANETDIFTNSGIETARRSILVGNKTSSCQCCKQPIPPERLKFIPGCLHCAPCQKEIDSGRSIYKREELSFEVEEESELTADEEEFAKKLIVAQNEPKNLDIPEYD